MTQPRVSRAKVADRIAKLLRLARDQPQMPEGQLAAKIAKQLMAEHGIEVALEHDETDSKVVIVETADNFVPWLYELSAWIAGAHGMGFKFTNDPCWTIVYAGPHEKVDPASERYRLMRDAILRAEKSFFWHTVNFNANDQNTQTWLLSWKLGFVRGLIRVWLDDEERRKAWLSEDVTSQALVPVSKFTRPKEDPTIAQAAHKVMLDEIARAQIVVTDSAVQQGEMSGVRSGHLAKLLRGMLILEGPIDEVGLGKRVRILLKRAKIHTVTELVCRSPTELLRIRGFGMSALDEVIEALAQWGLHLRADSDDVDEDDAGDKEIGP